MSLMVETIGHVSAGNATTSARSDHLLELAEQAGRQVVRLWENGITARKIITEASVTNAIKVCMAVGGSANTVIHIPAAATEAELELDCSEVYAQASQEIPLLVGIRPNGPHTMRDFDEAGGAACAAGGTAGPAGSELPVRQWKDAGREYQPGGKPRPASDPPPG